MIGDYYELSKPGIIYANLLTAGAGYLYAGLLHFDASRFAGLLAGLALVIAGACAWNNYLDRGIDRRMARTRQRAIVAGRISGAKAIAFATIATLSGFSLLYASQNLLTVGLAALASFDYVVLYGIGKRRSPHGTLIGCIAGAIPLVAGYTAVNGRLDVTAGLLFALMVVWQMGHFFGIALYRYDDYRAAGLPVMPVAHGALATRRQALGYISLFLIIAGLLAVHRDTGVVSSAVLFLVGLCWLLRTAYHYDRLPAAAWGRLNFVTSLFVIVGMALSLVINPLLV